VKQGIGIALATIVGIIAVIGISVGIWYVRVATSDTAGAGNAVINKNNEINRVNAQERFESLYAEIVAADRKIDVAAEATGDTAEANLTGIKNYCLGVVGDYNAEARKFSAADFRAVDLPAQIDNSDPSTDCEASK
jgi:hypothetical protein